MLLMLAVILMAVAQSCTVASSNPPSAQPARARRWGMPALALGIALALTSIPTGALAATAAAPTGTQVEPAAAQIIASGGAANEGRTAQANEYAAREGRAKGLENFKGGDTTVVIGGSALVIIVVVILILILI